MMELVQHYTVSGIMAHNSQMYPEKRAYIFDDEVYTWADAEYLTDAIAVELMKIGIGKGTHICFWSMNTIDLVFYMLASMKIGAVPAAINYSYRELEVKAVLASADAEYVFYGESKKNSNFGKTITNIMHQLPKLRGVRSIDGHVRELYRNMACTGSRVLASRNELDVCKNQVHSDDVAAITFTSGTTKIPKAVQVSFLNLFYDASLTTERMQVCGSDIWLAPLPLFHSSGLAAMIIQPLIHAIPTIIHRQFEAGAVMAAIEQYRTTVLMVIPSMLELMYRHEKFSECDFSSLRVILTSGAKISSERLKKIIQAIGVPHFLMAYGQTECSPLVTITMYDDDIDVAVSSDGKPLPMVGVRIWNTDKNELQQCGQVGEIQVCGLNTMKGYYGNTGENQKKYTRDRWLKTTDAGYFDDNGYLHFVSRMDDMIIWHGENISPCEIECVISQFSDLILSVKVVGVEAEVVQEEIAAVIQVREKIDEEQLKAFVRKYIAGFKVPKYVFQIETMPMTPTEKIDVGAVKRIANTLVRQQRKIGL